MNCKCCLDCYKIDACEGVCDFKCDKCSQNKPQKQKTKKQNKEWK